MFCFFISLSFLLSDPSYWAGKIFNIIYFYDFSKLGKVSWCILCQSVRQDFLAVDHPCYRISLRYQMSQSRWAPSGLGALWHPCQGLGSLSGWKPYCRTSVSCTSPSSFGHHVNSRDIAGNSNGYSLLQDSMFLSSISSPPTLCL